jgi:hypothetical protein
VIAPGRTIGRRRPHPTTSAPQRAILSNMWMPSTGMGISTSIFSDISYSWLAPADSPPACSAYLYWSTQCGAVGSGWAMSCSDGGTVVYADRSVHAFVKVEDSAADCSNSFSCVTHFHVGSAYCGFLGCKSLCKHMFSFARSVLTYA